jgi:hypothetical protein
MASSKVLALPLKKKRPNDVTEWLPLASLGSDPQVNRPLNENWADHIAKEFDPDFVGIVHVSERENGARIILDGQHRVAALRQLGWLDQTIECKLYHDLTLAQEAALFVHLNDFRRPTYFQTFVKRIAAQDKDAMEIDAIVRGVGLRIEAGTEDGRIQCVRTLERIYRGERFNVKTRQPLALRRTLLTAKNAWGLTKASVNGDLLHGLGIFLLRYDKRVDDDHLRAKLAPVDGGPLGIIGRARTLRSLRGGTIAQGVAEAITDLYNKGKREHKLPDWRAEEVSR